MVGKKSKRDFLKNTMHKITLLPGEKEFEAEEHESILEAALRSGLNMAYSCNNGSCGDCKAVLVAGEVAQINHFDYQFSEAEKLNNSLLLCCNAARSDCSIEAGEAKSAADIPFQTISAKISKIEQPHEDFRVLQLRTSRTKTLRFLAGQYVNISYKDGEHYQASIASCPCNGMVLEIHVAKKDDHPFVDHVFNDMKTGEQVTIEGPFGDFHLDEESQRAIVMVGVDLGFAPLKSLIEHAIALEMEQVIQLYWVVTEQGSHYRENYCRQWEYALDTFIYKPLVMDCSNGLDQGVDAIVNEIIASSPIETEIDLYLSGNQESLQVLKQTFIEKGTPQQHVFCDVRNVVL